MVSRRPSCRKDGSDPSGGVPAFADVDFTDAGVPAGESSSCRKYGDLRVADGSPRGSAECCRLSCHLISVRYDDFSTSRDLP